MYKRILANTVSPLLSKATLEQKVGLRQQCRSRLVNRATSREIHLRVLCGVSNWNQRF